MAKTSRKWFYNSSAWKHARMAALRRDMFTCAICGARASEVHHLVELDDVNVHDPNISLNLNNLQSLCHDCHSAITMQEHGIKNMDCDIEYFFDADGQLQRRTPPGVSTGVPGPLD
ncbi:MAG: HNH endonuclease, partial [Lachnospiraceae bacterium]|nr:HNH endonuclease [Lachnospiraceae bacterium]